MSLTVIVLLLKVTVLTVDARDSFNEQFEAQRKKCFLKDANRLAPETKHANGEYCAVDFYATCWPKTPANQTVFLPCPSLFFDHRFGNVSRRCNSSGLWERTNIKNCIRNYHSESQDEDIELRVYVALNWFSLSIMVPSIFVSVIFLKCKNERFNVHTSLILAFCFRILTFFIHHYGKLDDKSRISCNITWIMNRYFAATEIMWMLNEALLLLRKVVVIFNKKTYFRYYLLIGWVVPLAFMSVYIPVMFFLVDRTADKCWTNYRNSPYMLVLYLPLVIVLIIDLMALLYTVSIYVRRQKVNQKGDFLKIRKAIKGTLVLSPLLGVIYLLIFFVPANAPVWYQYFLRIAYPMQGTLACLVYITFSSELVSKVKLTYHTSLQRSRMLDKFFLQGLFVEL
ncbi:corticotropin-releasing factor receptor 1-like isoform X2 [Xenia sp. Carnegie-2017]|uniref:corticotropin-releasing factor receptor 1-like isoform X2 n=1 Tax=Xenia sp. Carnegie-2017 TaxID=2897299 RepID=UPI001F03EF26|nr:corticotropin-releasing factor receptor 1-like isoform X2 [Xenia sp. Carnegie-2017]